MRQLALGEVSACGRNWYLTEALVEEGLEIKPTEKQIKQRTLQAGIEFKKNLRERFGNYGGLKLEYFWVVKSKKAKSFIRG